MQPSRPRQLPCHPHQQARKCPAAAGAAVEVATAVALVAVVVLAAGVLVARTVAVVARTKARPAAAQAREEAAVANRTADQAVATAGDHTALGAVAEEDPGEGITAGTDGDTTHTPTAHPGKAKAQNHLGGGGGHS
jgi:hypothetical protein